MTTRACAQRVIPIARDFWPVIARSEATKQASSIATARFAHLVMTIGSMAELRPISVAVALISSVDPVPTLCVAGQGSANGTHLSSFFAAPRRGIFDIVKRAALPPRPAKGPPAPLCRVKSHEFGLNQYASVIISPASLKMRNAGICRSKFCRSHSAQTDAAISPYFTPFLLAGSSLHATGTRRATIDAKAETGTAKQDHLRKR